MKALVSAVTVIAAASTAAASPLSEALARHQASDVEALRARRDDPAARCTLGAVYARRGDLTRGALYLTGCEDLELPDDIGVAIRKIARATKKQLNDSDLSILEIASRPEGITAEIDALPGESLVTPTTLWVKAGTYEVRGTHAGTLYKVSVSTQPRARAVAYLDTNVRKKSVLVKDNKVDFTDEGAQTQSSGPPPAVKRPSLVPDRYLGKTAAAGEQLADPLATGRRTQPRVTRPWSIGARLGGGVFDDSMATPRAGLALAATGRFAIGRRSWIAGRLDWTRRGGDGATVDVGGVAAGAGMQVAGPFSVLAQLRGDLRFASSRADVRRVGASLATGIEVALPATPLTAGLRFERGITELAPGVRDGAVLVEVGIDWR